MGLLISRLLVICSLPSCDPGKLGTTDPTEGDQELILRFFALRRHGVNAFTGGIAGFLDRELGAHRHLVGPQASEEDLTRMVSGRVEDLWTAAREKTLCCSPNWAPIGGNMRAAACPASWSSPTHCHHCAGK